MKKRILLGAICTVLALSFASCDLLGGIDPTPTPTWKDTDYIKHRRDGHFKKIPEWLKGYWSNDAERAIYAESYFITDNNIFDDQGRSQTGDYSFLNGLDGYEEVVTADTYTLTLKDYWATTEGYESHASKDKVLSFTKTETGITATITDGDTVREPLALTYGRLLIPACFRDTWVSSNGVVELIFSDANLVVNNKSSGKSLNYSDLILPYVKDVGYCEYIKGKGYIEEVGKDLDLNPISYSLTVTDGETTLVNSFAIKDVNTIVWTQGDSAVDMYRASSVSE